MKECVAFLSVYITLLEYSASMLYNTLEIQKNNKLIYYTHRPETPTLNRF